jgi:hypothetical protein
VAAGRLDALVVAVVGAGGVERRKTRSPSAINSSRLRWRSGNALKCAKQPRLTPFDHPRIGEELLDRVEVAAVDDARVVVAHDLLALLGHRSRPFAR